VLGALWIVEAAGGRAVRLPQPLAERLRRIAPMLWLVVGLFVALIYTVVRNLL
jgi:peptidoglycan/LPS O-acetylase OafA/YrhL